MSAHKIMGEIGTPSLCSHIKGIRKTTDNAGQAIVNISEALNALASEAQDLINEVEADIENVENGIIAGKVTTPLATPDGEIITTPSGEVILAYRIL